MCNQGQGKVLIDSNPRKCSVCETYQRKIDDIEHSLSGREAIISILQNSLKKCEKNYKKLFDEFENLRFQHCTALQDNYSLKEINAKLEEYDLRNKCSDLQNTSQHNRALSFNNVRTCQESKSPFMQEATKIENLVTDQNQILKQLIEKIVYELKVCKCDSPVIQQHFCRTSEDFKNIECGDYLNPGLQELLNQVDALKKSLDKCQDEKQCMKQSFKDRQNNLARSQNISQYTSKSINKTSVGTGNDNSLPKPSKDVCCNLSATLASARRKAEDPNYYSSSAENKGRGLRKKKNRIYSFEEDTSDSDARTDTPLPEAPVFKSKIAQKTPSKCISEPTFVDVNESEYLQGDNYNICATSLENQLDGKNLRPVTATRDDTMRSCNASGSDSTLVLLSEKAIENIQKDNTTGVLQAEKGSTSTRTLLNEKDAETIQKDESVCASSSNKSQACVLNEIYIKIIKMEKLMENMSKSLSCLNVTNSNSTQHMELINVLPLKTHNDIFDFEKQNEDHEFRKAFMNFITNIGGKDIKDFVNRTLGHMFTNSLGKSCSLVGHRGNLRLDGFNFMQVLQDETVTKSNMDAQTYENKITELEQKIKRREKEAENSIGEMRRQVNDISDNNQMLSATLDVMRAENRNNLETVEQLKEELKRVNNECETRQKEMKCRISELEYELERTYINEKKLREALADSKDKIKELEKEIKLPCPPNASVSNFRSEGALLDLQQKIMELEQTNAEIKKELTEKNVELVEYEEENRALNQKIEYMTDCNNTMKQRINELEEQFFKDPIEVTKTDFTSKVSVQFRKDLEKKSSLLDDELNKCLCDECKRIQYDKLMTIGSLEDTVKMQTEKIKKLAKENADLKNQIEHQKNENKKETEKLQAMVNHSQRQVELLLTEHDEKTAQIQNVASELDGIRRSVTEENNSFLAKIDQLERERDQLKEQVEIHERDGGNGCTCGTCKRLNEEIYKKQLIILELEKTIDKFNKTMKQFEQNIECLACENECLRNDKETQNKNLECLRNELNEKIMENENSQEELDSAKRCCDGSNISLTSLRWENDKLKKENSHIQMNLERTSKTMEAEKFELQIQIERLKEEQCKKSNAFRLQLDCAQQQYKELENQCTEKCFECAKLEEHLENSKKIVEDLTKMKQDLQCECNTLKEQNRECREKQYEITQKMVNMQESCDKIKRQYTSKCLDCEDLKVKLDEEKEQYDKCANECKEMKKNLAENEKELACVSKRYNEIKEDCNQTCQELKKLKKQNEICCKQSQISRAEYNNLRREYKEIKKMLSDQIKRCKMDTGNTDAGQSCPNYCIIISDLKQQLYDKDKQVMNMQQKLKDSSYEIIELKDYIHKIVSDNKILKSAINSLISNLERKIKGPNLKTLASCSADAIAGEILQSLSTIENTIIRKSQGRYFPQGYSTKECNCLLQIQSQYVTNELEQGSSNDCCLDYVTLKPVPCPNPNPCSTNPCTSHPSTNICSETSTTDSDECPRCKYLDNNSVELLKETIRGLKSSKNKTTKEKSCDCEQRCCDISTCSNN